MSLKKKKEEAAQTHFIVGMEILPFGWARGPTTKKKVGFIAFILYCDVVNFIKMSHRTCDMQITSYFKSSPVLGLHAFSVMCL